MSDAIDRSVIQTMIEQAASIAATQALQSIKRPTPECINSFSGQFHAISLTLADITNTLKNIGKTLEEISARQAGFGARIDATEDAIEDLQRWKKGQWKVFAWLWSCVAGTGAFVFIRSLDKLLTNWFGD